MSDNLEEIARLYEEDVLRETQPISFGLFSIPEYPEYEKDGVGMWSSTLETLLTTLRYLAPATLLTLFWGQQSFLFRILRHIDLAFRTIVFSSDEQKESVLKWLAETGPVKVEQLDTIWRHGWILCRVLDSALPGSCTGHPPTRLSLKHAQTIADHYLGVDPVFTRQELESNDCLSRHQEWKFAQYLDRIRQALEKVPPPVSKPNSQRTSPEAIAGNDDYVARGSGLVAAQINNKMFFKIYPSSQQSLDPGEVTVLIKGPKDTYGMTVIPPILGKAQLIRQKLLKLQTTPQYTENTLPIIQGTAYLRTYGRNNMNKTYHIPQSKYDIDIEVETTEEFAKVSYIAPVRGKYEVTIASGGHNISGSPYSVTASNNILGVLEKENYCLEDGEEIGIVDGKTDRKVVLRIVDFVTEKMLLKENGNLEKISNEQASHLMGSGKVETRIKNDDINSLIATSLLETNKFKTTALKVITLLRVCKIFNDIKNTKKSNTDLTPTNERVLMRPHSQSEIPDIVNSTLSDPFMKYLKQDTEPRLKDEFKPFSTLLDKSENTLKSTQLLLDLKSSNNDVTYKSTSPSNPFFEEMQEKASFKKDRIKVLDEDSAIKILLQEEDTPSPTNPFIDPEVIKERPKTPVLKIINGEVKDRDDIYVDPKVKEITDEIMTSNEFINPFFLHQRLHTNNHDNSTTDFIIGAPVSLPPMVSVLAANTEIGSSVIPANGRKPSKNVPENQQCTDEQSTSLFSTPSHILHQTDVSSTFHSLESNDTENVNEDNSHTKIIYETSNYSNEMKTVIKEIWDSAYVSIDDNSSQDNNNNENTEACEKMYTTELVMPSHKEIIKMGPAEKELWQTCEDLASVVPSFVEAPQSYGIKRFAFTPIIEESERSISRCSKEPINTVKNNEADPVTVAFAELNDVFQEYNSNSESNSITTTYDDKIAHNDELEYDFSRNDKEVKSASELVSDVMRPTTIIKEESISAVQQNATESVSASRSLRHKSDENKDQKIETQFGDEKNMNIVLQKKKYWDEKIKLLEETENEEPKQKKVAKNVGQANITPRNKLNEVPRGATNFITPPINTTKVTKVTNASCTSRCTLENDNTSVTLKEQTVSDEKLVDKWKKYWDEKLETDKEENQLTCSTLKHNKGEISLSPSPTNKDRSLETLASEMKKDVDKLHEPVKCDPTPTKQELPEEVFKAFETSPKRFFGTSRKQILNKIDSFLVKETSEKVENKATEVSDTPLEKGIVSSRISQFHNIANVEPLQFKKSKSISMHNISFSTDAAVKLSEATSDRPSIEKPVVTNESHINKQKTSDATINEDVKEANPSKTSEHVPLKSKLSRISDIYDKSFEGPVTVKNSPVIHATKQGHSVQATIKHIARKTENKVQTKTANSLRKTSVSKSEMDIFSKISIPVVDDLDKHKSYDELPKTNVKSFISIYETATKKARSSSKPVLKRLSRTSSIGSENNSTTISSISGADRSSSTSINRRDDSGFTSNTEPTCDSPKPPPRRKRFTSQNLSQDNLFSGQSTESIDLNETVNKSFCGTSKKQASYISLSDIEVEIIDNSPTSTVETTPEREIDPTDYKSRFKVAKQYFQSLEELTPEKKTPKLNECEKLLHHKSIESLNEERPRNRVRKNLRARSLPSSEHSRIWQEMQKKTEENETKLVKISDKFNVDDLFTDVTKGKLSRQGSLRGIPHKKAVLETFRSMENVADTQLSPYEIAVTETSNFTINYMVKNAQTYLKEYPYLPTTDPSKYHSRVDPNVSGLISMKQLLCERPRRNSVPDLRLNPEFKIDL